MSRRLDPAFQAGLDTWLQQGMAASKRQMGGAWLGAYLNTPVWRFVLGPGSIGADPVAGLMIPSVDKVGRYFPLVLAVQLPGCRSPGTLFHAARAWFDDAEAVLLTALDDGVALEPFDRAVQNLGAPPYAREGGAGSALRLGLGDAGDMTAAYGQILDRVLTGGGVGFTLWWTLGSEKVRASVLLGTGMPSAANFAAFLDGNWTEWGWEHPSGGEQTLDDLPLLLLKPVVALPSAARTHPGTRRKQNEDALLDRPDLALWAVADGVGGHDAAQAASREVVERLAGLLPPLSFGGAVDELRELLAEANTALRKRAAGIADHAIVASTVVVLLIYGGHRCVLWSGDSRAYRLRGGQLEPLTRDHAGSLGGAVTHAIGAEPTPFVDSTHGPCEPGDRYLLCSDGVVKVLDDAELTAMLGRGGPNQVVNALIEECLVAGARDNITAVVVAIPG